MPFFSRSPIGPKTSFRAATLAPFVAAAGTTPFFVFEGSATKLCVVRRVSIACPTLTAPEYLSVVARKHSTAFTGGVLGDGIAAAALVKTPTYSVTNTATANACQTYTTAPTGGGTLVGTLASTRLRGRTTAATGNEPLDRYAFDFGDGIVLDGVAQGISLAFGVAPASAVTLALDIEWYEETA